MSREYVNSICAELPGAELSDPWGGGHDAWKVGGKMFACVGSVKYEPQLTFYNDGQLECEVSLDELRDAYKKPLNAGVS